MTASHRHAQPRDLRVQRAINRLYRLYVMRRAAGRTTAHLVARCGLLNRAYLQALEQSRNSES